LICFRRDQRLAKREVAGSLHRLLSERWSVPESFEALAVLTQTSQGFIAAHGSFLSELGFPSLVGGRPPIRRFVSSAVAGSFGHHLLSMNSENPTDFR
jgi:hypothetical protein